MKKLIKSLKNVLLPTSNQWKSWSIGNKLKLIGFYLTISMAVIGLGFKRFLPAITFAPHIEVNQAPKPKPFRVRLAAYLDGIDPAIVNGLRNGTTKFEGMLNEYQVGEFDKLLAETESAKYIRLLRPEEYVKKDDTLFSMSNLGTARLIAFELSPELVKGTADSP